MEYGALPPEINSGRMYVGAGAGPMLAAASAWDALAAELHSTAASYSSVISGLSSEGWLGPASASMATAATPYVTWMTTTATQAEQVANQARAAVVAYEAAFSATVPPPVIAANRTQLSSLVATNVLGQNTPAIAATEAHYGEMWAQDAGAMYGYHGASQAAAGTLTPFNQPPQTTNPGGSANQTAAVAQAGGNSAASNAQNTVSQLGHTLNAGAQGSGGSGTVPGVSDVAGDLKTAIGYGVFIPQNGSYLFSLTNSLNSLMRAGSSAGAATNAANALTAPAALGSMFAGGGSGLSGMGGVGSGLGGVTAGLGRAGSLGALSVPQTWAAATPATGSIGSALGGSALAGTPGAGMSPGAMSGMPMLANAAGRAMGGGQTPAIPRFDLRPNIIPSSPAAG